MNRGSRPHTMTVASCTACRSGVAWSWPTEVLDGPRSIVIQEAQNRMYAQMAVLHQMLAG